MDTIHPPPRRLAGCSEGGVRGIARSGHAYVSARAACGAVVVRGWRTALLSLRRGAGGAAGYMPGCSSAAHAQADERMDDVPDGAPPYVTVPERRQGRRSEREPRSRRPGRALRNRRSLPDSRSRGRGSQPVYRGGLAGQENRTGAGPDPSASPRSPASSDRRIARPGISWDAHPLNLPS
jgi:hypothetical protein